MLKQIEMAREFDTLCKKVFNTDDGHRLLAFLKLNYLDTSSIRDTVELTYYEIGKKEFIQSLINQVNNRQAIEDITLDLEADYNE